MMAALVVVSILVLVVVVGMVSVVLVVVLVLKVLLIIVVAVVTVVVRALMCAGELIVTLLEVLTFDMRVDVLIIVSNVAVGLLMDALTGIARGSLTIIDVDVNANVFVMPGPLEKFRC